MGWGLQSNNNGTLNHIISAVKSLFNKTFSYKKVLAFTLAETLIVIGIIGVVASLTIPNLNSSTSDREKVTKVKKIYSQLLEAEARAVAVYGPVEEWFTEPINDEEDDIVEKNDKENMSRYMNRITEFMKVLKVCNFTDGCFVKNQKLSFFGENIDFGEVDGSQTISVVLSDGASFQFSIINVNGLIIDIDGPNKGKNAFCDDIHLLPINEHMNLDSAYYARNVSTELPINRSFGIYFILITAEWIVRYGNMDYLKVGSDGKCPDGKTVLTWDQQTSCK